MFTSSRPGMGSTFSLKYKLIFLRGRNLLFAKGYGSRFFLTIIMLVMLMWHGAQQASAEPASGLTLAAGGVSDYSIVIPDEPALTEETAAKELQHYLERVSGTLLPIVEETSSQGKTIQIGATAMALTSGVQPSGEEAWAVKTVGDHLIINGGGARGVLYGVYHFLEEVIGVRWWSIWEEDVPSQPVITIETLDMTGEPAFMYRDIYINAPGFIASDKYIVNDPDILKDVSDEHINFYVRNRLNGQFGFAPATHGGTVSVGPPYFVHTASWYFHPSNYMATNPEYFATVNGVPGGQLCLSNEALQQAYAQKVIAVIGDAYAMADAAGLPRPYMFDISQNDEHGGVCPGSDAYDDATMNMIFVNNITKDVIEVYPDVKISTLAYMHYIDTPTVKPHDNVVIRFADLDRDNLHGLTHANNSQTLDLLEAWEQEAAELMVWDYGIDFQANGPLPSMYTYQQDYLKYKDLGITGIFIEDEFPITRDMWDMKIWMQAKLMENPNLNVRALMEDFTDGYYGPAGSDVLAYLDLTRALADGTAQRNDYFTTREAAFSYFTLDYVVQAQALLDSAADSVASDAKLLRRVNHARSALDRLIILKYMDFAKAAYEENIDLTDVNISRKASAARLVQTLQAQKLLRSELSDTLALPYTYAANADGEITQYQSFASIPDPVYTEEVDGIHVFTAADMRLHMVTGYGLSIVEDSYSVTNSAVKLTVADLAPERVNTFLAFGQGAPVYTGIYNVASTNLRESGFTLDTLTSGYKLYKIFDSLQIQATDFLILYPAWVIQKDLDGELLTNPNAKYDVYASMRMEGPAYGASGSNAIYLDRLIFVEKKEISLPTELSQVAPQDLTTYDPYHLTLYQEHGGITLVDDADAVGKVAAKVSLDKMTSETFKFQHYINTANPMPIGLYNPVTDDSRTIRNITVEEFAPDAYKLYKIAGKTFTPKDYLWLFRSWSIQLQLDGSLKEDADQLYDIYVSMKVQGEVFGGSSSLEDAIFIDRIYVVKAEDSENENPPVTEGYGNMWFQASAPTEAQITVAAGEAGTVSLGEELHVKLPVGFAATQLQVAIKKLSASAQPNIGDATLLSSIFEVSKNRAGSFKKKATIEIVFNGKQLQANQRAMVFVYDELQDDWTAVGGTVKGDTITAEVNQFGIFAVFAVPAPVTEEEGGGKPEQEQESTNNPVFKDAAGHWAEANLNRAASMGIIKGYTDGSFQPDKGITRAEFISMLMRSIPTGNPVTSSSNHFVDSKNAEWAYQAIEQAGQLGIVSGYPDGSFRPNEWISREQMAVMIASTLESKGIQSSDSMGYSDEKAIGVWAKSAVSIVGESGIMLGRSNNKFDPSERATRAEAITALLRLIDVITSES